MIDRDGNAIWIDLYDVLIAFKVTNNAIGHAIKKMMVAGRRGDKSEIRDWYEAIISIKRAIEQAEAYDKYRAKTRVHPRNRKASTAGRRGVG